MGQRVICSKSTEECGCHTNAPDGSQCRALPSTESPRFHTGRGRPSCEWERVPCGSMLSLGGDAGRRHPLVNNDFAICYSELVVYPCRNPLQPAAGKAM